MKLKTLIYGNSSDELNRLHKIEWIKVKGHSDNEYNNKCDKIATDEIKKHVKEMKNKE